MEYGLEQPIDEFITISHTYMLIYGYKLAQEYYNGAPRCRCTVYPILK
jgi:hypothetical protein